MHANTIPQSPLCTLKHSTPTPYILTTHFIIKSSLGAQVKELSSLTFFSWPRRKPKTSHLPPLKHTTCESPKRKEESSKILHNVLCSACTLILSLFSCELNHVVRVLFYELSPHGCLWEANNSIALHVQKLGF